MRRSRTANAAALEAIDEMRRTWARQEGWADGRIAGVLEAILDRSGSMYGKPFTLTVEWPEGPPSEAILAYAERYRRELLERNSR